MASETDTNLPAIVERMSPNEEQRRILARTSGDIVVTAGAGTGKTRTLVARYLELLALGHDLRSVVAVTFTRKAAHEMRNRVREAMRQYVMDPDLPSPDRSRWQRNYAELDAARIDTIHSLCSEILRAHPAESGLDLRFSVLDEAQSGMLLSDACDAALSWAATREECASLFTELSERELRGLLRDLLRDPANAEVALAAGRDDPLGAWQSALVEAKRSMLAALIGSDAWAMLVAEITTARPLTKDDLLAAQWEAACTALQAVRVAGDDPEAACAALAPLATLSLSGGKASAWPGGKSTVSTVKESLKGLRSLWKEQAPVLSLTLGPLDELLASLLSPLDALFHNGRAAYDAAKDREQAVDYDDLERLALDLLSRCPDVLARWQGEVSAVLVDEFQDTNPRQAAIVDLLRGDRDIRFLVGDAKQSIYGFRGADVTVFAGVQRRAAPGTVHVLSTSYRAHAGLISGLNALFEPLLGTRPDPVRPWKAPFGRLEAARADPAPGFSAPHIELHIAAGTKKEGALDRAAEALVQRIVSLVEGGQAQVREGSLYRPLGYGDVAVLCRATSSFGPYEDALERVGVPFVTVAGRGFYDRPEVRDAMNALMAIGDLTDDLPVAGLLRSPAVGLADAAIYRLREQSHAECPSRSLWDALCSAGASLGGTDGARAERAVRVIGGLAAIVGRTPVADVLKGFLDQTAYRAALTAAGQTRAARNLDKLLDDARASGIVSVGEFVQYVAERRNSAAREGEARTVATGSVQLMSVHAAKGLEFPVVAIGDAGHASRPEAGWLLDPVLGLTLRLRDEDGNLPAAFILSALTAEDKDNAESDRLLYVAATRAMEKLLVSGTVSLTRSSGASESDGWLKRLRSVLVFPGGSLSCDPEGTAAREIDCQVGEVPIGFTLYEPRWTAPAASAAPAPAEVPVAWQLPPPLIGSLMPSAARADPSTEWEDRRPAPRVWDVVPRSGDSRTPGWVLGQIVHEALASWRVSEEGLDDWVRLRARGYGVADEVQVQALRSAAARLLSGFRNSPLFAEMSAAERLLHELPYARYVDGVFERGIIDALYLRNGHWRVVEFKTDHYPSVQALCERLRQDDYVEQTRRYVAAVTQVLGEPPDAVLCLLDLGGATRDLPLDTLCAMLGAADPA